MSETQTGAPQTEILPKIDTESGLPPLEERLAKRDRSLFTAEERQAIAPPVWLDKGTGLDSAPHRVEDFEDGEGVGADAYFNWQNGPERAESAQEANNFFLNSTIDLIDKTLGPDNKQSMSLEGAQLSRHEIPDETGTGEASTRYEVIFVYDRSDTSVVITRTGEKLDVTFHGQVGEEVPFKKDKENFNGTWTNDYLGLADDQESIEKVTQAAWETVKGGVDKTQSEKGKPLAKNALSKLFRR